MTSPNPNGGGNTPPNPNTPPPSPSPNPNQGPDVEEIQEFILDANESRSETEQKAHEDAVRNRISSLPLNLDTYKSEFHGNVDAEIQGLIGKIGEESKKGPGDQNTALIQRLTAQKTKLEADKSRFDQKPEWAHTEDYLASVLAEARTKYAKELAARSGQIVTGAHGRKSQVSDAQREWEIAHGVITTLNENGYDMHDKDEARRAKEGTLKILLGAPGDDPATSDGEFFKLSREQVEEEKILSGRFVREDDGTVVEKQPNGRIAKALRFVEDTYAKWNEEIREAKHWYSPKALWARTKKAGSMALAGAAVGGVVGAAGAVLGAGAAVVTGSAIALGTIRGTKAAAGAHLNRKSKQTMADKRGEDRAERLALSREMQQAAIEHGYNEGFSEGNNLNVANAAHMEATEEFTDAVNSANRKQRISTAVTAAGALFGVLGGAELLHDTFLGDGSSSAEVADAANHGTGSSSSSQTPTSHPSTSSSSPSTTETSTPSTANSTPSTTNSAPSTPNSVSTTSSRPPETSTSQATSTSATPENKPTSMNNDHAGENKDHSTDTNKPSKTSVDKSKQPVAVEKAPDAKIIKMDVIKPGDWVWNVYQDQLGNAGPAEMLENAKDALEDGEIEKIDLNTGEKLTADSNSNNYFFRLTEKGATSMPGAKTGSDATADIVRILAGHSKKLTLVG